MPQADFTPALRYRALTPLYDLAISAMTRERRWRGLLLAQVAPQSGDVIADIGCGTGTFAAMMAKAASGVRVIGIDPDGEVLERAARKAAAQDARIEFLQGYARDASHLLAGRGITKIVSSLVLHQVPLGEKRAGLVAMFAALRPGGSIHIADYGLQRTALMRLLFRQVQTLDGFENTTPNARGVVMDLLRDAGFANVVESHVIPTPTGSISIYRATKPGP